MISSPYQKIRHYCHKAKPIILSTKLDVISLLQRVVIKVYGTAPQETTNVRGIVLKMVQEWF